MAEGEGSGGGLFLSYQRAAGHGVNCGVVQPALASVECLVVEFGSFGTGRVGNASWTTQVPVHDDKHNARLDTEIRAIPRLHLLLHQDHGTATGRIRLPTFLLCFAAIRTPDDRDPCRAWVYLTRAWKRTDD